jgi:hypothetical protein
LRRSSTAGKGQPEFRVKLLNLKNTVIKLALCAMGAAGIPIGYKLAAMQNLQPYKLVNIIGLLYSLLAVIVLSEVFITNTNWKKLCVEWLAPFLLWAQNTIPLGCLIGTGLARVTRHGPSASVASLFSISAFAYSGLIGMVLEQTVALPTLLKLDIESRWRWFGLTLLLTGILLQLISAVQSLTVP